MCAATRCFAGDPLAVAVGGGDASVERHRELERDERPPLRDVVQVVAMHLAGLLGQQPDFDRDTAPTKATNALTGDVWRGVTEELRAERFEETEREAPECAPCMLRDCPIDHRCMTAIAPEDVLARSMTILRNRVAGEAVR